MKRCVDCTYYTILEEDTSCYEAGTQFCMYYDNHFGAIDDPEEETICTHFDNGKPMPIEILAKRFKNAEK